MSSKERGTEGRRQGFLTEEVGLEAGYILEIVDCSEEEEDLFKDTKIRTKLLKREREGFLKRLIID